jgi:hypothetical protein
MPNYDENAAAQQIQARKLFYTEFTQPRWGNAVIHNYRSANATELRTRAIGTNR